jgi:hypothetical protein
MTIDAELGVGGKVRAELQKKRPEVLVHAVEIVMVDHPCRLYDPGRSGREKACGAVKQKKGTGKKERKEKGGWGT